MKWRLPHLCALALAISAAAQTQTPQKAHELDVPGNQPWTDTGIDLQPGQTVTITATGKLQYMDNSSPGPQGAARGWRDMVRALPVNSAGRGALIGRLGSDEAAQPFLIGGSGQLPVRVAGRLFLGINGPAGDTANGSFHVKIEISGNTLTSSAPPAPISNSVSPAPATAGSGLPVPPAGPPLRPTSTLPS